MAEVHRISGRSTDVRPHARWVRIFRWIVTASALTLAFTGVEILMVHQRLHRGVAGNDLTIGRNQRLGGWETPLPFFINASGPVSASRIPSAPVLSFSGVAVSQEPLPRKPDRPFTVFVLAKPGDETQATDELSRGAEELKKRVAKKKDWFLPAARMEDAEIVVEVNSHSVREYLTFWASTRTMGGETQGMTNSTISHYHSLRATVILLGATAQIAGTDPRRTGSVKGAASALMKELVKLCQERYQSLEERRIAAPGI